MTKLKMLASNVDSVIIPNKLLGLFFLDKSISVELFYYINNIVIRKSHFNEVNDAGYHELQSL